MGAVIQQRRQRSASALRNGREKRMGTTECTIEQTFVLSRPSYERLAELALAAARLAEESEALLLKLDRGHVIVDSDLENIVRMGSTVRYKTDKGDTRTITLVFPRGKGIGPQSHRDRALGSFGWAVSYLDRPAWPTARIDRAVGRSGAISFVN